MLGKTEQRGSADPWGCERSANIAKCQDFMSQGIPEQVHGHAHGRDPLAPPLSPSSGTPAPGRSGPPGSLSPLGRSPAAESRAPLPGQRPRARRAQAAAAGRRSSRRGAQCRIGAPRGCPRHSARHVEAASRPRSACMLGPNSSSNCMSVHMLACSMCKYGAATSDQVTACE